MSAVFWLIDAILGLYVFCIFAMVVMSWLLAFNVVNPRNQFVAAVGTFLRDITDPVLRPIRRLMPNLGSVDLSPIILLFGIWFLQRLLRSTIAPMFGVFAY